MTTTATIAIPADAITTVPLSFHDQFGRPSAPLTGGSVQSNNMAIANVALSPDGLHLIVTPASASATGTVEAVFTSPTGTTSTFTFDIVQPTPHGVGIIGEAATYVSM